MPCFLCFSPPDTPVWLSGMDAPLSEGYFNTGVSSEAGCLLAIYATVNSTPAVIHGIIQLTFVFLDLVGHLRYRSIITSFLHAWKHVAPREIFKYSRSVFAWTTISRGVEHTRLVYHHAWLLHARLLHAWPLHAWLLHTWLAITRVVAGHRQLKIQSTTVKRASVVNS